MKITNIMNFVRTFEPRDLNIERQLYDMAKSQLELSLEMDLPSTFLLEYDALCDERYIELYKSVVTNPKIEIGLWYEIVEPLTSAIGIPYNSKRGYKWDWLIDPGYSMAYPLEIRGKLIDEAMKRFYEVFGFYPRTVGSWVLDTYTTNHLYENYEIDAFLICRDQVATDAYTMVGGFFGGAYYPSRNNVFTPGKGENKINVPVFRLLGSDPIHNYDSKKYLSNEAASGIAVYTLEPAAPSGRDPVVQDWFFDTYYGGEYLGIAYTQVGQENSFANIDLVTPLSAQYTKLKERNVKFLTTSETGRLIKKTFERTPPTSVSALKNWDTPSAQSIYYSSEHYTANLLYFEGTVALRALYLFDDKVEDLYLRDCCTTYDSVHENLPIVDTYYQRGDTDGGIGIKLDTASAPLTQSIKDGNLTVCYTGGNVVFLENKIIVTNCKAEFAPKMKNTTIYKSGNSLCYEYKNHQYALKVEGGRINEKNGCFYIDGECVALIPNCK